LKLPVPGNVKKMEYWSQGVHHRSVWHGYYGHGVLKPINKEMGTLYVKCFIYYSCG